MTEKEFLERYDSGGEFTETEIKGLVDRGNFVDEIEGDDHRWDREITTIIEVDGRYFAIDWRRGLTEYQGNWFDNQPREVTKTTRMVEVTEWIPMVNEDD